MEKVLERALGLLLNIDPETGRIEEVERRVLTSTLPEFEAWYRANFPQSIVGRNSRRRAAAYYYFTRSMASQQEDDGYLYLSIPDLQLVNDTLFQRNPWGDWNYLYFNPDTWELFWSSVPPNMTRFLNSYQ